MGIQELQICHVAVAPGVQAHVAVANGALVFVACTDISCSTSSPDLCFIAIRFVLVGCCCCSSCRVCVVVVWLWSLLLLLLVLLLSSISATVLVLRDVLLWSNSKNSDHVTSAAAPKQNVLFHVAGPCGCTMSHLASVPQGPRLRQNALLRVTPWATKGVGTLGVAEPYVFISVPVHWMTDVDPICWRIVS